MHLNLLDIEDIVRRALMEDIGAGDITTAVTVSPDAKSTAHIIAKEDGVIAGMPIAAIAFSLASDAYYLAGANVFRGELLAGQIKNRESVLGAESTFRISVRRSGSEPEIKSSHVWQKTRPNEPVDLVFAPKVMDGSVIERGEVVAQIIGPTSVILTAERVALNFIQRMSGIATKTAYLTSLVKHTKAKIVDTRKTTPGLRVLEKYAVRCGGGGNHRFGLYDAILIKDNHIQAAGGIGEAVRRAKTSAPHTIKVEVEADTLDQVKEALEAGADMILLDNMSPNTLEKAVQLCKGRAVTEASGGITEETIVEVAETGIDLISVGALTHSVKAMDLSLDIVD